MAVRHTDEGDYTYTKRIRSYLDFMYKINYSNKVYVSLKLISSFGVNDNIIPVQKYKVYIGKGNNSLLIESLLKRRFWL